MRFVALVVVGSGLALGGLAGCGSASSPVTGPPPVIASSGAAPAPSASRSSPGAGSAQADVSVRGTVKDGVEPGCVLLATDQQTYLLVGGDKTALKSGSVVTVYGRPEPELMSTCQQGTPFRVTRVEN
jgi:hypothetical protein